MKKDSLNYNEWDDALLDLLNRGLISIEKAEYGDIKFRLRKMR